MQQLDYIIALHPGTLEAFGPGGEDGFVQTFLPAGEGEGEPEGQSCLGQLVVTHELVDAVSDVVKELLWGINEI